MAKLVSMIWEIGKDSSGRRVTLEKRGEEFSIIIAAGGQMDKSERLDGLPSEVLIEAGKVASPFEAEKPKHPLNGR